MKFLNLKSKIKTSRAEEPKGLADIDSEKNPSFKKLPPIKKEM